MHGLVPRCLAESNRCSRFCRPVPNRSAKAPIFADCKDSVFSFIRKLFGRNARRHHFLNREATQRMMMAPMQEVKIWPYHLPSQAQLAPRRPRSQPPRIPPRIPRMMLISKPNPPPRIHLPASHPATAPMSRKIMKPCSVIS